MFLVKLFHEECNKHPLMTTLAHIMAPCRHDSMLTKTPIVSIVHDELNGTMRWGYKFSRPKNLANVCCLKMLVINTVYPKKYAHGFCFAVLCCGYTLTDFPISIRLTSLALWQSNDCPSASKATLMNMDKYFIWIHYERLHNHNKAKHNKTVCIFLGIYCIVLAPASTTTAIVTANK